jgi:hypothetical protein
MDEYSNCVPSRTRTITYVVILIVVLIYVVVLKALGVDIELAIIAAGAIGVVSAKITAHLFGDPDTGAALPSTPDIGLGTDNL